MLNYISAEFYKLRFHKGLLLGVLLLLALEGTLFLPAFWVDTDRIYRETLYLFLATAMGFGVFLVPIFASSVFDDPYGNGTLKNEVVCGIPRERIYLGKFLSAALAGTAVAALAIGWFLLLTWLFTTGDGTNGNWAGDLTRVILSHWLTWVGELAAVFLLLVLLRSSGMAMIVSYLTILIGVPVALIGVGEDAPMWIRLVVDYHFAAPLRLILGTGSMGSGQLPMVGGGGLLSAVIVAAGWVLVTAALGIWVLRRREVK